MGGDHVCAPPPEELRRDTFRVRSAASRFRIQGPWGSKTSSQYNAEWWAAFDADRNVSACHKSVVLVHPQKRRRDDSQKDDSQKVQKRREY